MGVEEKLTGDKIILSKGEIKELENLTETSRKPYLAQEYQNHYVFNQLDDLIKFYNDFAFGVFQFMSTGVRAIFNIDSYVYSSMAGTLDSIKLLLKNGRINDAYALTRKYYDAVIMDIYKSLYLEEHKSLENFIVKEIDDWVGGTKPLPWYKKMINYIRSCEQVKELNDYFDYEGRYELIRKICNNHNHYNAMKYVMLNDNEISNPYRKRELFKISVCIKNLFILHFSNRIVISPNYLSSTDYIDSLDFGLEPEPDSQYWLAPYIQKAFDKYIAGQRPNLSVFLKQNSCMQID